MLQINLVHYVLNNWEIRQYVNKGVGRFVKPQ